MKLGNYADLSPERTLEIVLASIAELVDYELAVVLGYDGEGRLRVRSSRGPLAGPRIDSYSIALAERPDLAALLEAGEPRLFAEDEAHLDTYAEILELPDGHSCLASPIVADGEAIGLLTFDHRRCGVFATEILRIIAVISRLIAVALAQTDRARELKAANARLAEERNRLSGRSEGPFVALNCSALPAALAESELFGHEKGSFTGAQGLRRGRFELASGGTLFLDELGDLPLEIQPKLLRAILEGRFERVGGERPVSVDVRLVAATHVDLEAAAAAGRFREDLFYRVAVFPVRLPPLREREGDAVAIAGLFVERLRARPGWEGLRLTGEALDIIAARRWPGNVRELRNAVERAAILARGGTIGASELGAAGNGPAGHGEGERALRPPESARPRSPSGSIGSDGGPTPVAGPETLAAAERRCVEEALRRSGGRVYGSGGAASMLGIPQSTLQSRMRRLGIPKRPGS